MRIVVDKLPKYSYDCLFCAGGFCELSGKSACRLKQGMPCDRLTVAAEISHEEYSYHGRQRPVCKCDYNGNFLEEYPSIRKASDLHGIPVSNIQAVCSGKRKTAGGYIWRYKEQVDI